jgi:stearoyl-CoA desaturase (delta-9 desaturase)
MQLTSLNKLNSFIRDRYYLPLVIIASFAIPSYIMMKVFTLSLEAALTLSVFRYMITLHITWLINSVSHIGSWKPYDKNIEPSDSKFWGTVTFGEGE